MIRKYREKDLNIVLDIWYKSSTLAHSFLDSDFVKKVKKDMRELYLPNSKTWVYEEDYIVVGFISMIENEIGGLFVLPNYHSKGIGIQLVNFVKEFHNELEVEVFEKNPIGRAFYNKYGFQKIKQFVHKETGNNIIRLKY
ncbi:GNAT family N-acetyltransferase [Psychroserpens sp.]